MCNHSLVNLLGDITGPINFYRAALRIPVQDPELKGSVKVPTLLVWGTKDVGLSKELSQITLNYVPNCRLKYVEGGSHWIQQEEPQIVNDFMTDFLSNSNQKSKL